MDAHECTHTHIQVTHTEGEYSSSSFVRSFEMRRINMFIRQIMGVMLA